MPSSMKSKRKGKVRKGKKRGFKGFEKMTLGEFFDKTPGALKQLPNLNYADKVKAERNKQAQSRLHPKVMGPQEPKQLEITFTPDEIKMMKKQKKDKFQNELQSIISRVQRASSENQKNVSYLNTPKKTNNYNKKEELEQVSNQIVSGYFNNNIDITRGQRNYQRIDLVVSEVEFRIRNFLVPYIKKFLKKVWPELLIAAQANILTASFFNDYMKTNQGYGLVNGKFTLYTDALLGLGEDLTDIELEFFIKVLLSSMGTTQIKNVNSLANFDTESELEMQNMYYIFMLLKNKIKELVDHNEYKHLGHLLYHTNNLRNAISHEPLIQDRVFEELQNDFIHSVQQFKINFGQRSNKASEEINAFANNLDLRKFYNMFGNKSPEGRVEELSGIKLRFPIENRKRVKHGRRPDIHEYKRKYSLRQWCEYFQKKEKRTEDENKNMVMEFFEIFPQMKEAYYEGYFEPPN